jgi:hypothetical protein
MDFFVMHPIRAWIVAGAWFAVCAWVIIRRRALAAGWSSLLAGVAWMAYGFWEWYAKLKGYNIRVDLFMIYPVLGVVSLLALVFLFAALRKPRPRPPVQLP